MFVCGAPAVSRGRVSTGRQIEWPSGRTTLATILSAYRSSSLPETLRWNSECPVETRGRVFPRDDHRQLRDGVGVEVSLQVREQIVVDVAGCHGVGVGERHFLRLAEQRAFRVFVKRIDLICRAAESAAHGSIGVLSKLAAVPPGNATIQQPAQRAGHALGFLL